jgi:hypothetical protein
MRTFGEPTYNSDLDQWESNIVNIPERDEDYHEQYEDDAQYEAVASKFSEKLQDKAIPFPWLVNQFYSYLYDNKDITIHPNRIYPQLSTIIRTLTWQDLIDMMIITETDAFKHFDNINLIK